jgi:hypothetical protein
LQAKFWEICLPERYEPSRAKPGSQRGIERRPEAGVAKGSIAHVVRLAFLHGTYVLEQKWHPAKRAVWKIT